MIIRLGTRGSKLAIAQSEWVKRRIISRYPDIQVEITRIRTKGDRMLDTPLSRIGGKGLFVKEIEDAILDGRIDIAVHSMKDLPVVLPDGLEISAVPEREDPRDAFLSANYRSIGDLPEKGRVGTSSLRRRAQILYLRPDLEVVQLRGNVDTRIRKLKEGEFDAIVLASAGLKRIGYQEIIREYIAEEIIVPAIGQGALAIESRSNDQRIEKIISFLDHAPSRIEVEAERSFLRELEGGCQVPIGAICRYLGDTIRISGMVAEINGSKMVKDVITADSHQPHEAGVRLAKNLLNTGARTILEEIYGDLKKVENERFK